MVFQGSNTTNDGRVEYMRYKKADEEDNFSQDIHLNQGQKMYFHKATSDDVYINGIVENGSNMLEFANRDSIGQIRFKLWDGGALSSTLSMSWNNTILQKNTRVASGYSITGELVDTSSEKVQYDIKEAEYDFTSIVNNIKPKTFKLNKEKIGIYKNHIGFIAETVEENVPTEIQNIVYEVDGVKGLNYVKLNTLLWGCVQK